MILSGSFKSPVHGLLIKYVGGFDKEMSSFVYVTLIVAVCALVPGLRAADTYTTTPTPATVAAAAPRTAPSPVPATAYHQFPVADQAKFIFHGYYAGVCAQDGFYVNGPNSLVVCSNGRAHIQPCAPGTRNAAVRGVYVPGVAYQYTDFCNENLNDYVGTANVVAAGVPYYPAAAAVYPYYHHGFPYVY